MNSIIELEEKKKILLDILSAIMSFCDKNNLKYYLTAGTLLGAVRHNGFIPWDDDIDIMMPIDDFNELMKLTKKGWISDRYSISTPINNKYHMWPFIKVCDAKTTLTEDGVVDKRHIKIQKKFYGIYVDVFPMYGLPVDEYQRILFQKKLSLLHKHDIYAVRCLNKRKNDSEFLYLLRKSAYSIFRIPYLIRGNKYYVSKALDLANQYPLKDAKYFGFDIGLAPDERTHNSSRYLDNETKLIFETLNCPVLKEYDKMLRRQYGDYMQLPPIEQRRYHPSLCYWKKEEPIK